MQISDILQAMGQRSEAFQCRKRVRIGNAEQVSQKGSVVLLSPAAASYGFFKNFEERGDRYQMYIKNEA